MIGQTVSHYKIVEKLGEGGMGVVYKAHDMDLDRDVALKFINPDLSVSGDGKSRFLREARAISALDHPNICTIFEVGTTADEQMFLALAFYEGISLREKLDKAPVPVTEAVSIAAQVCLGLQAAHDKNIIHRDIKPGNIMVSAKGIVKIMDFGLAKFLGRSQITGGTVFAGTLAFMSPEQVRGGETDCRTDIWSLGVVLYQMVTGCLPFSSPYDQGLVYSILNEVPKPPTKLRPEIPKQLEQIILRCLRQNPSERYQTAEDLADALLKLTPGGSAIRPRRMRWYPPAWVRIAATGVLTFVALLVLIRFFGSRRTIRDDAIVIGVQQTNELQSNSGDLTSEMVDFLVADDVLGSARGEVYHRDEFQRLFPDESPALDLSVSFQSQDPGYTVTVSENQPGSRSSGVANYHVHDCSALLTLVIPEIRRSLVVAGFMPSERKSTFTNSWDAFVRFYDGLRAWERLDITTAKADLDAAISIDSQFVLPKLCLAETHNFMGSYAYAESLLQSIHPSLGQLSKLDSLRAEAVSARVSRDFRREVAIRRSIYQVFPLRKESAYDVAEAYYSLCEIPEAVAYYKAALALDPKFARAYDHLGYCYAHLGEHDSALMAIHRYLELDSTANAYDSMGDCFLAAGYLDSAAWAKFQGIARDPKLLYLYSSLVYIHLRQGKLNEADEDARNYMRYAFTADLKARGLTDLAFIANERRDYTSALQFCRRALQTFDSWDLGTRNPELHWLYTLLSIELGDVSTAKAELREMKRLLRVHKINATNYQMYYYKYYLLLQAYLSAQSNNIPAILDVANELDGPLRYKVKDWSSPFDYAFLSTFLGQLFADPPLRRTDFALQRFDSALAYNPRYAPAHYNLWKLYGEMGQTDLAQHERTIIKTLWKDADESFKRIWGLPE